MQDVFIGSVTKNLSFAKRQNVKISTSAQYLFCVAYNTLSKFKLEAALRFDNDEVTSTERHSKFIQTYVSLTSLELTMYAYTIWAMISRAKALGFILPAHECSLHLGLYLHKRKL